MQRNILRNKKWMMGWWNSSALRTSLTLHSKELLDQGRKYFREVDLMR